MDELSAFNPEPIPPAPAPMRLSLPLSRPLFSWIVLALNVVIWLLMTFSGGSTDLRVLIRFGAKVPWLGAAGEYWRLFTAIFLHIGLLHLVFNSYALYSLGPQIESLFGRSRFLVLYLLSGLAGNVAGYVMSESVSAGASGAIFGLIGALAVYLARHRHILGRRGQRALSNVVFIILYNLVLSLSVPGIDVFGHLGGLAGGLVIGRLLCPDYNVVVDGAGTHRMLDRNSLGRQKWWLVLVSLVLIIGVGLGTLRWQDSARTLLVRGLRLLERQDVESALSELKQAVAKAPRSTEALFYLAVAHHELGQYAEAAAAYERALGIDPNLAAARWNLALVYVALDRRQAALEQFRAYLTVAPGEKEAAQARTWIAQLEGLNP